MYVVRLATATVHKVPRVYGHLPPTLLGMTVVMCGHTCAQLAIKLHYTTCLVNSLQVVVCLILVNAL